ncbi:MAG TPA: permease [Acidimicrobiales bacterium]|nr:permease [Acidimicrobiales bacterium]
MLASSPFLLDVGRSLREAFFMFWVTLWPLILGFGLSGAVQAFVRRDTLRRKLGDHGPPAVARATVFGMVSSSCSYAASAMAKSLFVRGADYIASLVFMFASTNLVIELGIVLIVLMGWQFAVSEFVGGFIMIGLLATLGALWLRGRLVVSARARLESQADSEDQHAHAGHVEDGDATSSLRTQMRSPTKWADSATYTMADLTMLRRDLFLGYLVAGFLCVLVPTSAWQALFVTGHGFWTSVENAIVGPLIAIISFVCSIGNVPLAATLWHGGISFGGVIAFLFADLITFPLLMIYRKYYGTRLMLRMLVVFWALMSTAALVTELIFRAAGAVPTTRPATVVTTGFSWNYTTYLNIVFLALFALLYWTYRNRERLGAGGRYARDPVCGMQVEMAHAPASLDHGDQRLYFCSDHCAGRFAQRSGPGNVPDRDTETTTDPEEEHTMDPQRMMERLDAMVSNGRITVEEAAQLRSTDGTPAFDDAVAGIRARHAQAHTDPAVADGTMSQEEADGLLERVLAGEHSTELRKQVRGKH